MSNKHTGVAQIPKPFLDACPELYDCVSNVAWDDSDESIFWRCFHLGHDVYVHDLPHAKATKKGRKTRWLRFDTTYLNDLAELCDMLLL